MNKYDIEFEVNQKSLYTMSVEAANPIEAIEKAQDPDFDRHEAEEDTLLESYDDVSTIVVVGERVPHGMGTCRESFATPIRLPLPPNEAAYDKYRATSGNRCPLCDSEHIIAHPFNADCLDAWRDVECTECEATWRELFTMQNLDLL